MFWALLGSMAGGAAGNAAEANAAEDAAQLALRMGRRARAAEQQMYADAQAFMAPYREAGLAAIPALEKDLYSRDYSPANDYQTNEELRALKMRMAAGGKLRSGSMLRGASDIYSRAAEREYNQRYGRYMNLINAGAGHSTGAATDAGRTSDLVGNLYMSGANQLGNIAMAGGQANAALYGGLGKALGTYLQDYYAGQRAEG